METWKDIKGYDGIYRISNSGIVVSLKFKKKKPLKPRNNKGYMCVNLSKNNKQKTMQVHRLVADAFISNLDNKPQVNHIDHITTNNNYKNLEWCTAAENSRYKLKSNKQTSSIYKGVYYDKKNKKWGSGINIFGSTKNLGRYLIEGDAALAYNRAAIKYFGKFSKLNKVT